MQVRLDDISDIVTITMTKNELRNLRVILSKAADTTSLYRLRYPEGSHANKFYLHRAFLMWEWVSQLKLPL